MQLYYEALPSKRLQSLFQLWHWAKSGSVLGLQYLHWLIIEKT